VFALLLILVMFAIFAAKSTSVLGTHEDRAAIFLPWISWALSASKAPRERLNHPHSHPRLYSNQTRLMRWVFHPLLYGARLTAAASAEWVYLLTSFMCLYEAQLA